MLIAKPHEIALTSPLTVSLLVKYLRTVRPLKSFPLSNFYNLFFYYSPKRYPKIVRQTTKTLNTSNKTKQSSKVHVSVTVALGTH